MENSEFTHDVEFAVPERQVIPIAFDQRILGHSVSMTYCAQFRNWLHTHQSLIGTTGHQHPDCPASTSSDVQDGLRAEVPQHPVKQGEGDHVFLVVMNVLVLRGYSRVSIALYP